MGDYNLGTARGTIEIEYKGDGVTQAQQGLGGLKTHASSADEALNKTGNTAAVAGGLIAGGLALAVNSAANFEQRLSAIQAVSGNTAAEMEKVRSKALQIGKDTSFSASEAAQAMEELSKAGISTADILGGAADATVALAAAGEVDLPFAAQVASNAMNQFNLKAADMPKVADIIAGAANASAIDVKEFGNSLSQVGAVANLAGLSFKDTAIAIAEMGNAGIKGSDAGTSLKTMLSNLIPTTKQQINEMVDLGIITGGGQTAMEQLAARGIKPLSNSVADINAAIADYVKRTTGLTASSKDGQKAIAELGGVTGAIQNQFFNTNGEVKSLAEIQGVLAKAYKNSTKEEMLASQGMLFGSDAIRASAILTKEGADGYNKMAAAMGKVSAADVAKTRLDNMKGSVEALKGSTETLAIQLGSILLPAIRSIVDGLNSFLGVFLSLPEGLQKFIVIGGAFLATLLLLVAGVIKAKLAFDAMKVTMIALNGTFLANPIFLIIVAIIALVAAIVLAYKNSETFRNIVQTAWGAIKDFIGAVVTWITDTAVPWIIGAWDKISGGAQALWGIVVGAWNAIYSGVSTAAGATRDFVVGVWNAITGFTSAAWNLISSIISTVFGFIVELVTSQLNMLKGIWDALWGTFGPLVKAVWDLIVAIINLAFALINYAVNTGILLVKTVVEAGWNFLKTITSAAWDFIKGVVTAFWGWIQPYIQTVVNFVAGIVQKGWELVKSYFMAFWNWATPYVTSAATAIKNGISTAWDFITSKTSDAYNKVKSIITTVWDFIKSITSTTWNYVSQIISDKTNEVTSKVSGMINTIKNFFSNAGSWLYNAGRDIIQGLINGVTSMINALTDKLNQVTKLIPGSKGPPAKDKVLLEENGQLIMTGLINGINDMVAPLRSTLSGIGVSIPDTITASVAAGRAESSGAFVTPVAGNVYNTNIYNPLPESAGESTNKRLQTLTSMGV